MVRRRGQSGAADALHTAQAVSHCARQAGCGIDEATEIVAGRISRRQFLGSAAAVATVAAVPSALHRTRSGATADRAPHVVIVGAGIAGLACAYRLQHSYGIAADVFEYNRVPGGRIRTLRGHFTDDQTVEAHAEFINPEHTATLSLARSLGLSLDNRDKYPAGTHPFEETLRFHGHRWSQAAVNRDWHEWGWALFHRAAFVTAPWPQLYSHNNPGGRRFDHMSVREWIDSYVPGGMNSDFGALCVAAVLDEFGGPVDEQSALNLVYLLGQDSTTVNGFQPRRTPALGGADEKWHIRGGNDQLITGLLEHLPAGMLHLDRRLVALKRSGADRYLCTFDSGPTSREVKCDHVVLAMPFTTLRLVDLTRVPISPLHRRAIEEEPLGTNSKFFLQFRSREWNTIGRTGNCYDGALVQGGWDASLHQSGRAGILAALPGGVTAERWGRRFGLTSYEGPAPAPMVEAYLKEFDSLFPGVAAQYNGHSYFVWSPGDPHILGAYSYLKAGQYTAFNGIQGQQEGNLHFAGEQTSLNFQGYIEGALRSGYRCADEIAR
jgi:monoamine oxidase